MKTPAQLAEILDVMIASETVKTKTVMTSMADINHQLIFPSITTHIVPPKFEVPMAGDVPTAHRFVEHMLKDQHAIYQIEAILKLASGDDNEMLFLQEVQNTSKAFQKQLLKDLGTPDTDVIEVYHHNRDTIEFHSNLYCQVTISPTESVVKSLTDLNLYERAGVVIVPKGEPSQSLEKAFERTQTIDDSWTGNADVIPMSDAQRSSMVGDVMLVNGKPFVVAMMGFKPLDNFEPYPQVSNEKEKKKVIAMDSDGFKI